MGLADLTHEAVLAALREFDALGREAFLEKYGFDEARSYFLVHEDKRYDSKAIVGAAHGFLAGREPLAANEFSGPKVSSAPSLPRRRRRSS
jgi:5-methylcytosine-specific restriction protein A